MPTLLIFDGNALVHRAYHAVPPLNSPDGRLVNAVYGFMSSFLAAIKLFEPTYVAVAFDVAGGTFRDDLYKEYKATRVPADQALYDQIPLIQNVLETMNVPMFGIKGFEADDVIATIVAKNKGAKTIIVTGDNDALQLVNDNVKVYSLARGVKNAVLYDEQKVLAKYGIPAKNVVDLKAIAGDASDNIKGVPGIGPKGAVKLIVEYGAVEIMVKKVDKIKTLKKEALLAKKIVTMRTDVPLDFELAKAKLRDYDRQQVEQKFEQLGFKSLLNRLPHSSRIKPEQQGLF